MRKQHFILGCILSVCTFSIAHAGQTESNTRASVKKEHSIVRDFAASLNTQQSISSLPKQANFAQLLQNVNQLKSQPRSSEEMQALASINARSQSYLASSNSFSKLNTFIQSFFGS